MSKSKSKYNLDLLSYNQVWVAIPKKWKNYFATNGFSDNMRENLFDKIAKQLKPVKYVYVVPHLSTCTIYKWCCTNYQLINGEPIYKRCNTIYQHIFAPFINGAALTINIF